jgi:hypothetical protein
MTQSPFKTLSWVLRLKERHNARKEKLRRGSNMCTVRKEKLRGGSNVRKARKKLGGGSNVCKATKEKLRGGSSVYVWSTDPTTSKAAEGSTQCCGCDEHFEEPITGDWIQWTVLARLLLPLCRYMCTFIRTRSSWKKYKILSVSINLRSVRKTDFHLIFVCRWLYVFVSFSFSVKDVIVSAYPTKNLPYLAECGLRA